MSTVTHEQVNLMLRLFEMRREPRLRQAREWFIDNFHVEQPGELMTKYPPGSDENASFRMTVSYWEMCASIVNRGLIDDELYFENNGEAWAVFDRVRSIVPAFRAMFGNPKIFGQLEALCARMDAWREKNAPGSTEKMRALQKQMTQMRAQKAGRGRRRKK
jgi:hypothetical protein